jgi:hypothetical protein
LNNGIGRVFQIDLASSNAVQLFVLADTPKD